MSHYLQHPKLLLALTSVAALSPAYPASVQAVPTTYQYTGNPFTTFVPPYTASDFVTAMVTLAGPLGANMPLTQVTPTAFTLSDGVQTFNNSNTTTSGFAFATGPTGMITEWSVVVGNPPNFISTTNIPGVRVGDDGTLGPRIVGANMSTAGDWVSTTVPEAGSSLAALSLSLTALGVVARRFKRAAA